MRKDQLVELINNSIRDKFAEINQFCSSSKAANNLLNSTEAKDGEIGLLEKAVKEISNKLGSIQEYYNTICEGNEDEESFKTQLKDLIENFTKTKEEGDKFKKEI